MNILAYLLAILLLSTPHTTATHKKEDKMKKWEKALHAVKLLDDKSLKNLVTSNNVNIQDPQGKTLLHYLLLEVREGRSLSGEYSESFDEWNIEEMSLPLKGVVDVTLVAPSILRILFKRGASLFVQDKSGVTSWELADDQSKAWILEEKKLLISCVYMKKKFPQYSHIQDIILLIVAFVTFKKGV